MRANRWTAALPKTGWGFEFRYLKYAGKESSGICASLIPQINSQLLCQRNPTDIGSRGWRAT